MIDYEDFKKLDMRVGKIVGVEKIKRAKKLYKIKVNLGYKTVQLVSSLIDYYEEEELLGKDIVVLTNLKPAKFSGEISEGMLLCAESEKDCVLLTVDRKIDLGSRIT
jgi:methionine--tRNA ligase beta chain